jgi:hypothetical protein
MNNDMSSEHSAQNPTDNASKQFYLARFEKVPGKLLLDSGAEPDITLVGEFMIAGRPSGDGLLIVDEILRLSLGSDPVKELDGVLSFAGPANEIKFEPGIAGVIEPFDMRLYYPFLGKLEPACAEEDAEYPQLATLEGQLKWEPEGPSENQRPRARITIKLEKVIEPDLNTIQTITLEDLLITFEPIEEKPLQGTRANSLAPCSPGDAPTAANGVLLTVPGFALRDLKVRFVRLFDPIPALPGNMTLHDTVQELINGACEVWWYKGGVRIVPTSLSTPLSPEVDVAAPNAIYPGGKIAPLDETNIRNAAGFDFNSVNVYLATELLGDPTHPREGGGMTYGCGTSGAFILLDIRKAATNRYLLAHELGHVLGIRHPGDPGKLGDSCRDPNKTVEGSFCSVMVPDSPNSSRNTAKNLGAINSAVTPLMPIMTSSSTACGVRADSEQGYFHIVRDFPSDDGTEPSAPRPATYPWMPTSWWTHSDVWNNDKKPFDLFNFRDYRYADPTAPLNAANATPMFGMDFSPNHVQPTYSGPNFMYVRLHTCQDLDPNQDVKVYVFLAVPGASNEPLLLIQVVSGSNNGANPLLFTTHPSAGALNSLPSPGIPKVLFMKWNVPPDPIQPNPPPNPAQLYPRHCCVFAVAYSVNETFPAGGPTPHIGDIINDFIADPNNTKYRFYDLFNHLKLDNDVAQRNLNIQGTAPGSPLAGSTASRSSMLAWVQMDNPFEKAAIASLNVDTTEAHGLTSLALEVDDEFVAEIKPGELKSITIADALEPEDHKIIRFRATLPTNATEGMSFPIHLQFIVKDQLVNGFSHMLRVVPLSDAVLEALDLVYGALRAVVVGCKLDQAQPFVEKVKGIVLSERLRAQSSGCLGWILRLLWPRSAWRSKVTSLSGGIAALARSLEGRPEPECQAVRKHLTSLADVLLTHKDTPAPVFIEEIRELADRIQEPASRLARRQLRT